MSDARDPLVDVLRGFRPHISLAKIDELGYLLQQKGTEFGSTPGISNTNSWNERTYCVPHSALLCKFSLEE